MKIFLFFLSILQINYISGAFKKLGSEVDLSEEQPFCDIVKHSFKFIPTDMSFYDLSIFDDTNNSHSYQPLWYHFLLNWIFGTRLKDSFKINENIMELDIFFKDENVLNLIKETFSLLESNDNILYKQFSGSKNLLNNGKFKSFEDFGNLENAQERYNLIKYITDLIKFLKTNFTKDYYPNYILDFLDSKDYKYSSSFYSEYLKKNIENIKEVKLPKNELLKEISNFKERYNFDLEKLKNLNLTDHHFFALKKFLLIKDYEETLNFLIDTDFEDFNKLILG